MVRHLNTSMTLTSTTCGSVGSPLGGTALAARPELARVAKAHWSASTRDHLAFSIQAPRAVSSCEVTGYRTASTLNGRRDKSFAGRHISVSESPSSAKAAHSILAG